MNMYNARESELVERFPNQTTRLTKFENSADKWNAIESAIREGVEKLNRAMTDDEELKRIIFANGVSVE
jgi:rRNA-processing protein FCF1